MTLLDVTHLKTRFLLRTGLLGRRQVVHAVDGVSFSVGPGETLGLVGESGCGKSTLARSLIRLETPATGRIMFQGIDVSTPTRRQLRRLRCGMQMIFQDPYASLNPRLRAGDMLCEVLRVHTGLRPAAQRQRARELLELVGLDQEHVRRYPHQFSGGQRQRLGIARALAVEPRLILADEPVSALDVSVQAQIINLLQDLQEKLGIAYLFIAHDLSVVEHISHRVAVMYLGRFMETATAVDLYASPLHPYTQALFACIPTLTSDRQTTRLILPGDVPSPLAPPPGCPFHPRCPRAVERCRVERPVLLPVKDRPGHAAACHVVHDQG